MCNTNLQLMMVYCCNPAVKFAPDIVFLSVKLSECYKIRDVLLPQMVKQHESLSGDTPSKKKDQLKASQEQSEEAPLPVTSQDLSCTSKQDKVCCKPPTSTVSSSVILVCKSCMLSFSFHGRLKDF